MNQPGYRNAPPAPDPVIVTTGFDVSGHRIVQYLGIVRGIVVRSVGFTKGFVGGFRSLGGGSVKEYVEVCESARQDAYLLMMEHAQAIGAHAVIGMHYDATEFVSGSTEVLAYGTAVRLER